MTAKQRGLKYDKQSHQVLASSDRGFMYTPGLLIHAPSSQSRGTLASRDRQESRESRDRKKQS